MTFARARTFDVAVFTLSLLALSLVTLSGVAEEERGKAEKRSELSIDGSFDDDLGKRACFAAVRQ